MSEAELYVLLSAGRLSKVQRESTCNVCPPAWCASRIPASSKIPIARSNMLSSSSWPRLKNWAHATGSYGTASSRTSAFRSAMSVGARTETSSGVSPRNRPFAPSSPTRLCRGLRHGRRTSDPTRQRPGRSPRGSRESPRAQDIRRQWTRTTRDGAPPDGRVALYHLRCYPAYISWAQYLANQARLQENAQRYTEQGCLGPGAPGKAALLQGLATCGSAAIACA